MEFIAIQQTHSLQSNTYPRFKILNNRIYYVWNARDIDNTTQVWFATSNLDGSNFVETQLTEGPRPSYNPELYIYNNIIYLAWYGPAVETGKFQAIVSSMNLDGSGYAVLYITDSTWGIKYPKIAVNSTAIYLAYQQRHLDYEYYHMMRAKLDHDGSNFVSYPASTSANENVGSVNLFLTNNKIYYMWRRHYFIDAPASVNIYSSEFDLLTFTSILQIPDAYPTDLFVKNNKIYFTWSSGGARCSVINDDGTAYEELLINSEHGFTTLLVTTDANENDIIDFAILNLTSSSYPFKTYQLLSAYLNLNTSEYSETVRQNDIVASINFRPSISIIKNDDVVYYVWNQYDENNDFQIWLGIFGEDDPCEGVVCPDTCIGYDQWGQECNPDTGLCVVDRFIESQSESCDYEPSKLWLYLLLTLPPAAWISTRIVGEAKKRREL